jgi:hypothetical protein
LLANFNGGGFGLANSSKRHNSNTKYEVFHTGAFAQPILVLYGDTINEGRIIARRAWAASDGRGMPVDCELAPRRHSPFGAPLLRPLRAHGAILQGEF